MADEYNFSEQEMALLNALQFTENERKALVRVARSEGRTPMAHIAEVKARTLSAALIEIEREARLELAKKIEALPADKQAEVAAIVASNEPAPAPEPPPAEANPHPSELD